MINTILQGSEQFETQPAVFEPQPTQFEIQPAVLTGSAANVPTTVFDHEATYADSSDSDSTSGNDESTDEQLAPDPKDFNLDLFTFSGVKQTLKEKIRTRRESEGVEEITNLFEPPKKYKLTAEEEIKNAVRKQRNRISANKSRLKRIANEKRLEKEAGDLEAEHKKLKAEVESLTQIKELLTKAYGKHKPVCKKLTGYHDGRIYMTPSQDIKPSTDNLPIIGDISKASFSNSMKTTHFSRDTQNIKHINQNLASFTDRQSMAQQHDAIQQNDVISCVKVEPSDTILEDAISNPMIQSSYLSMPYTVSITTSTDTTAVTNQAYHSDHQNTWTSSPLTSTITDTTLTSSNTSNQNYNNSLTSSWTTQNTQPVDVNSWTELLTSTTCVDLWSEPKCTTQSVCETAHMNLMDAAPSVKSGQVFPLQLNRLHESNNYNDHDGHTRNPHHDEDLKRVLIDLKLQTPDNPVDIIPTELAFFPMNAGEDANNVAECLLQKSSGVDNSNCGPYFTDPEMIDQIKSYLLEGL